jgi:hypothetical protein
LYTPAPAGRYIFEAAREKIHVVLTNTDEQHTSAVNWYTVANVESLLTDDFVFTSPYDYRIDRETYFKRCWPYSEKSPSYGIEKLFEKGSEVFVLYDCKTKDGGRSRKTELFVIERNKIKEVEVYFGSTPKDCGGLNGSTQH